MAKKDEEFAKKDEELATKDEALRQALEEARRSTPSSTQLAAASPYITPHGQQSAVEALERSFDEIGEHPPELDKVLDEMNDDYPFDPTFFVSNFDTTGTFLSS